MSFYDNGVTGHRGDPQHFPQNTLPGFEAAIKLGCDWVETDMHLTRDGRVVISHDHHTRAQADKFLVIKENDFSDLRKLNMATRFNIEHDDRPPFFEAMPSLEETLELFRSQDKVRLSLQPKAPGTVAAAAKIIRDMKFPEEMLGFNDGNLAFMCEAKETCPDSTIFYDICNTDQLEINLADAQKYGFRYLVANENFLRQEDVDRILGAGFLPGVWNINNPGEMDRFIAMGVKRFYTDYPAVLMKKLGLIK
ncbi:MAG: hypothetical protein IJW23_07295 [Lentisphaeria bacterium]|nr:hypothetical protein [Lentisphaeria bacterium]